MTRDEAIMHRHKRRRRRQDKPPISAKLVLDSQLKGDFGVLSEDLMRDLYPGNASVQEIGTDPRQSARHVAITPWTALSTDSGADCPWTIIPVTGPSSDSNSSKQPTISTINFPASSLALQTFAHALQDVAPLRVIHKTPVPIEIRLLDVVPLVLEKVFVSIELDSLQKLSASSDLLSRVHDANRRKGPDGRSTKSRGGRKDGDHIVKSMDSLVEFPEDRLRQLVRDALKSPKVVHTGDLLPLALPSHPITHVPPPPVKVTLCEPVSQGILSVETRIVVTKIGARERPSRDTAQSRLLKNVLDEDAEDTSDDKFYSAVEDGGGSVPSSPSRTAKRHEASTTEDSVTETSDGESGDLSDDSLGDIISLQGSMLSSQPLGSLSAFESGTPRGTGPRTDGISTPGSVFSNYTSMTARPTGAAGRLFKACGLSQKIPSEAIHPSPASDEDDEARVFVDTGMLVKIGCFSGDWVRLQPTPEPQLDSLGSLVTSAFDKVEDVSSDWRAAKAYGLPESLSHRPRRFVPIQTKKDTPSFGGSRQQQNTPTIYLSPILLANLGGGPHLRISPVQVQQSGSMSRSAAARTQRHLLAELPSPPLAKEVALLRLATPISIDRSLQGALLTGLKGHFEDKQRLVKTGDLVAVSVDSSLGKTVSYGAAHGEQELEGEELVSASSALRERGARDGSSKSTGVAWFEVGHLSVTRDDGGALEEDKWGGLAAIDATNTRMVQSGSSRGKLPGTLENPWRHYLGVQAIPGRAPGMTASVQYLQKQPASYTSSLTRRLRELVTAATSIRAIHLGLPPVTVLLHSTQRGIGKAEVAKRACEDLGIHLFEIDAYDILTDGGASGSDVKTEALLKARCERALTCGPEFCAILIRHVDVLTADRMITALKDVVADSRILIASTTEIEKVPEGIRSLFSHELEMSAPDEKEREGLLRSIIDDQGAVVAPEVDLAAIAIKTAALVAGDLVDVVNRATVARQMRVEKLVEEMADGDSNDGKPTIRDVQISGGDAGRCLTKEDFNTAVDAARVNFADAIGAPKIPSVGWNDVGGLTHVKDAVMETIQLPLERPELFAKGMKKRSGILFYGPPGTGKTLLAKAIATEFSLNFFSVKGPELLNMYIGESEANVRRVFQRARDARPCVVFFDELDSVAPKRGNQGDSGGVMDRIVSQLLAELDGMSDGEDGGGGVFVIGATNRPDLLDAALLRPGRFDKMLYLGISDTHDQQLTILEALTRKFTLHPQMSLRHVAEKLPFTYTGADLYALCSDAMLKAITRQASAVDARIKALPDGPVSTAYFFDHHATKEDVSVMVTEEDFLEAERELVGSVSAKELEHYDRVRKTFEAKDDKATDAASSPRRVAGTISRPALVDRTSTSNTKGKGREVNGKEKSKGKGKGKAHAASSGGSDDGSDGGQPKAGDDDGDGHHVIRTDHLKSNGKAHGNGILKGSGGSFDDPSKDDETELYG